MKMLSFNKGEIIFKQGDYSSVMYDIVAGTVGVYVNYGEENETRLTVLDAGKFLGEMGMIEVYPRSATAVAMEDGTELREIGEKEFGDFFSSQPERLLEIMRQNSERLRARTEDFEVACLALKGPKETEAEPEKRSKSLLEKAKKLIDFYNNVMAATGDNPNLSQIGYFPYYFTRM